MSKNTKLLTLAIVSPILSRVVFFFIDDPEGPNLVVVVGLAAVIFLVLSAILTLWQKRS